MKTPVHAEALVVDVLMTPSRENWALRHRRQNRRPVHIGKIFEPLLGIGTILEPDANRRDSLATAPSPTVKNGKPCPTGTYVRTSLARSLIRVGTI